MSTTPSYRGSLFSALKNLAATLLASGRTRLELLGNELEEEKLRAFQLFLLALGLAFCLSIGLLMLVLFLTVAFWESRVLILGISCAAFLGASIWLAFGLKQAVQRPRRMFDASLSELEEDLRQLKAAIGQHDAPAE